MYGVVRAGLRRRLCLRFWRGTFEPRFDHVHGLPQQGSEKDGHDEVTDRLVIQCHIHRHPDVLDAPDGRELGWQAERRPFGFVGFARLHPFLSEVPEGHQKEEEDADRDGRDDDRVQMGSDEPDKAEDRCGYHQ